MRKIPVVNCRPETVRLKVAKRLAEKFRVTRYHYSQQARELPNGEIEVTFTVTGAQEMIPWLVAWGPTIDVLEPKWLRKALAENPEENPKALPLASRAKTRPFLATKKFSPILAKGTLMCPFIFAIMVPDMEPIFTDRKICCRQARERMVSA